MFNGCVKFLKVFNGKKKPFTLDLAVVKSFGGEMAEVYLPFSNITTKVKIKDLHGMPINESTIQMIGGKPVRLYANDEELKEVWRRVFEIGDIYVNIDYFTDPIGEIDSVVAIGYEGIFLQYIEQLQLLCKLTSFEYDFDLIIEVGEYEADPNYGIKYLGIASA